MGERRHDRRAVVWCGRHQAAFVERVVRRSGLVAATVGIAPRGGEGGADGALFDGVDRFDDLRHAAASSSAGVVLLASGAASASGSASPLDDARFLGGCAGRGQRVVSFEPVPGEVGLLDEVEEAEQGAEGARVVPLLVSGRVFADAAELLEQLGEVRSVSVQARCSPEHGTLGSRLFDAMSAVRKVIGLPDRIDCSVTGAGGAAGSLRGLNGHATAHLRYAGSAGGGGRSAAVMVSNRAGGWFRGVTVLGDTGVLRFSDTRIELMSPSGEPLDRSTVTPPASGRHGAAGDNLFVHAAAEAGEDAAADLFAAELKRALDPSFNLPADPGRAEALAMCGTALLSARTGAQEDTQTIMDMRGKR